MLDERKMRAELHKIIDSINFDLLKKDLSSCERDHGESYLAFLFFFGLFHNVFVLFNN